jgi:hypothetical protein
LAFKLLPSPVHVVGGAGHFAHIVEVRAHIDPSKPGAATPTASHSWRSWYRPFEFLPRRSRWS